MVSVPPSSDRRALNGILIWLLLVPWSAGSTVSPLHFECDAISRGNLDFGRRLCFFRHMRAPDDVTTATILPNSIADEKRELIFDNCTLYALPRGIFQQFPHVKTVYAWHVQLKVLEVEAFESAAELTKLDLSQNAIAVLAARTFVGATNLTRIDLSKNHLNAIDADAFFGLAQLQALHLDYNRLDFIAATLFSPLRRLQTIRLGHNAIKTISVEQFARNANLQHIHLNDNAIEWMLGEHTFRHLSHVIEFDLHNNPITNLRTLLINAQTIDIRRTNAMACFVGARTRRLLAGDNRITFVDTLNGSAANLQYVDLANNRLDSIRNLTRFDALTHLDVSHNRIADIGLNSFAAMAGMEYLNLRHSGLDRIHFGSFSHKLQLHTLDVAFNGLHRIDFHMFVPMPKLRSLHVDGNNLTNMDVSEIRQLFPALKTVGISMNAWNCANLAAAIKYLESNGVAVDTDGPIRNTENIKGIPCRADDGDGRAGLVADEPSDLVVRATEPPDAPRTHVPAAHTAANCAPNANIVDSELFVRLIDLKYQTLNAIESVQSISSKLENFISQLQNQ